MNQNLSIISNQSTSEILTSSSTTSTSIENSQNSYATFNIGDLVFVERRAWSGINKEGGVGKITYIHQPIIQQENNNEIDDNNDDDDNEIDNENNNDNLPTYDVTYVLGGKEQKIPVKYITLKRFEEVTTKSRSKKGRCRYLY